MGGHTGTVWPFDNAIIAAGLRRYGYRAEAATIAAGILDAAEFFGGRLPGAFAGYEREFTRYPVRYPGGGSPQALPAAAPLLLLRTMLGLRPHAEFVAVDPALPAGIGRIELLDVPTRWATWTRSAATAASRTGYPAPSVASPAVSTMRRVA